MACRLNDGGKPCLLVKRQVATRGILKAFGEKGRGVIEILHVGADFQTKVSAGAQASAAVDDFKPALGPCPTDQNGNLLATVFDAGFEGFIAVAVIIGVYSCKP